VRTKLGITKNTEADQKGHNHTQFQITGPSGPNVIWNIQTDEESKP
jgi:hypothetical protein